MMSIRYTLSPQADGCNARSCQMVLEAGVFVLLIVRVATREWQSDVEGKMKINDEPHAWMMRHTEVRG